MDRDQARDAAPASYSVRTSRPGAFGATMKTLVVAGGRSFRNGSQKPCENARYAPGRRFSWTDAVVDRRLLFVGDRAASRCRPGDVARRSTDS